MIYVLQNRQLMDDQPVFVLPCRLKVSDSRQSQPCVGIIGIYEQRGQHAKRLTMRELPAICHVLLQANRTT